MMETAGKASSYVPKRKTTPKSNGPQFTIPRLKKIKRDLLTELSLESHECQNDILAPIRKSFHFRSSNSCHEFLKVQAVHNPDLVAKYLDRRKDMKSNGYSDSLVSDTIAFLPVENVSQVEQLCREGIKCGNQKLSGLGVPSMAVHVCKHADIISPMKPKSGEKVLIAVKVIKGRMKTVVCRGVGCELEPTPNYDSHIAKSNLDESAMQSSHIQFYSSQLYLYEYGDFDVEEFPRQVLPFAVIYYIIKEPKQMIPKVVSSLSQSALTVPPTSAGISGPAGAKAWHCQQLIPSFEDGLGPNNEVWRGRLHIRLIEGGHIYIEVSMLSHYVPLTVNIISPIKIHSLFPEHNAQFTFLNGLSNLAEQAEVEWRAHYFRSYLMRPRPNNEGHFKALVKHISSKREMPTVRLPNDVFLFLMPNCLLASQLGLVRMEENSPVLHCVLMSKFSTSEAAKKKLALKHRPLPNLGTATSWEELFDDSDSSDEEASEKANDPHVGETQARLAQILPLMFKDQRSIENKFAAMSLADAEANLPECSCKSFSESKAYKQKSRDMIIQNILTTLQSVNMPSQKSATPSHFPAGSRRKPKVKMSRRTRNMPSFSPHGSSESESDSENGHKSSRKSKAHLTILHSTKTVEEELSEEELTNEQMEDIIFMRKKPVQAPNLSRISKISLAAPPSPKVSRQIQQKETSPVIFKQNPKASSMSPIVSVSNDHLDTLFDNRAYKEPSFSSKPKIIPMEPVEEPESSPPGSPKAKEVPQASSDAGKNTTRFKDKEAQSVGSASDNASQMKGKIHNIEKKTIPLDRKDSSLVKSISPKPESHRTEPSANAPLSIPKAAKNHELALSLSATTPVTLSELPISSAPSSKEKSLLHTSPSKWSEPSSSIQNKQNRSADIKKLPSPTKPPVLQLDAQFVSEEVIDYGDVDMRDPKYHSTSLNPVFLSASEKKDIASPPRGQSNNHHFSSSPNLSFGMWLAPGEIAAPLQPPPFPALELLEEPTAAPLSLSPPSSPVSLPANSPPSPADSPVSPPTESPASPPVESSASPASPLTPADPDMESPMSPPPCSSSHTSIKHQWESPMSPPGSSSFWTSAELDIESPMSPPRSSTFSMLRSTPIAIPTSRLEQQMESPEINYLQRPSPFSLRSLNAQAIPSASVTGIDNADDMKDFLNGGFNSDLDSSYDDESPLASPQLAESEAETSFGLTSLSSVFLSSKAPEQKPNKQSLPAHHSLSRTPNPGKGADNDGDVFCLTEIENSRHTVDCQVLLDMQDELHESKTCLKNGFQSKKVLTWSWSVEEQILHQWTNKYKNSLFEAERTVQLHHLEGASEEVDNICNSEMAPLFEKSVEKGNINQCRRSIHLAGYDLANSKTVSYNEGENCRTYTGHDSGVQCWNSVLPHPSEDAVCKFGFIGANFQNLSVDIIVMPSWQSARDVGTEKSGEDSDSGSSIKNEGQFCYSTETSSSEASMSDPSSLGTQAVECEPQASGESSLAENKKLLKEEPRSDMGGSPGNVILQDDDKKSHAYVAKFYDHQHLGNNINSQSNDNRHAFCHDVQHEAANNQLPHFDDIEQTDDTLLLHATGTQQTDNELLPLFRGTQQTDDEQLPLFRETQQTDNEQLPLFRGTQQTDDDLLPLSIGTQQTDDKLLQPTSGTQQTDGDLLPLSSGNQQSDNKLLAHSNGPQQTNDETLPHFCGSQQTDNELLPPTSGTQQTEDKQLLHSSGSQQTDDKYLPYVNECDIKYTIEKQLPHSSGSQQTDDKLLTLADGTQQQTDDKQLPHKSGIQQAEGKLLPHAGGTQKTEDQLLPQAVGIQPTEDQQLPHSNSGQQTGQSTSCCDYRQNIDGEGKPADSSSQTDEIQFCPSSKPADKIHELVFKQNDDNLTLFHGALKDYLTNLTACVLEQSDNKTFCAGKFHQADDNIFPCETEMESQGQNRSLNVAVDNYTRNSERPDHSTTQDVIKIESLDNDTKGLLVTQETSLNLSPIIPISYSEDEEPRSSAPYESKSLAALRLSDKIEIHVSDISDAEADHEKPSPRYLVSDWTTQPYRDEVVSDSDSDPEDTDSALHIKKLFVTDAKPSISSERKKDITDQGTKFKARKVKENLEFDDTSKHFGQFKSSTTNGPETLLLCNINCASIDQLTQRPEEYPAELSENIKLLQKSVDYVQNNSLREYLPTPSNRASRDPVFDVLSDQRATNSLLPVTECFLSQASWTSMSSFDTSSSYSKNNSFSDGPYKLCALSPPDFSSSDKESDEELSARITEIVDLSPLADRHSKEEKGRRYERQPTFLPTSGIDSHDHGRDRNIFDLVEMFESGKDSRCCDDSGFKTPTLAGQISSNSKIFSDVEEKEPIVPESSTSPQQNVFNKAYTGSLFETQLGDIEKAQAYRVYRDSNVFPDALSTEASCCYVDKPHIKEAKSSQDCNCEQTTQPIVVKIKEIQKRTKPKKQLLDTNLSRNSLRPCEVRLVNAKFLRSKHTVCLRKLSTKSWKKLGFDPKTLSLSSLETRFSFPKTEAPSPKTVCQHESTNTQLLCVWKRLKQMRSEKRQLRMAEVQSNLIKIAQSLNSYDEQYASMKECSLSEDFASPNLKSSKNVKLTKETLCQKSETPLVERSDAFGIASEYTNSTQNLNEALTQKGEKELNPNTAHKEFQKQTTPKCKKMKNLSASKNFSAFPSVSPKPMKKVKKESSKNIQACAIGGEDVSFKLSGSTCVSDAVEVKFESKIDKGDKEILQNNSLPRKSKAKKSHKSVEKENESHHNVHEQVFVKAKGKTGNLAVTDTSNTFSQKAKGSGLSKKESTGKSGTQTQTSKTGYIGSIHNHASMKNGHLVGTSEKTSPSFQEKKAESFDTKAQKKGLPSPHKKKLKKATESEHINICTPKKSETHLSSHNTICGSNFKIPRKCSSDTKSNGYQIKTSNPQFVQKSKSETVSEHDNKNNGNNIGKTESSSFKLDSNMKVPRKKSDTERTCLGSSDDLTKIFPSATLPRKLTPQKPVTEDVKSGFIHNGQTKDVKSHATDSAKTKDVKSQPTDSAKTKDVKDDSTQSAKTKDIKAHSTHCATTHCAKTKDVKDDSTQSAKTKDVKSHSTDSAKTKDVKAHSTHSAKTKDVKSHATDSAKTKDVKAHSTHSAKTKDVKSHATDSAKTKDVKAHSTHSAKTKDVKSHATDSAKTKDVKSHSTHSAKTKDVKAHSTHSAKTKDVKSHATDSAKTKEITSHATDSAKTKDVKSHATDSAKTKDVKSHSTDSAKTKDVKAHYTQSAKTKDLGAHSTQSSHTGTKDVKAHPAHSVQTKAVKTDSPPCARTKEVEVHSNQSAQTKDSKAQSTRGTPVKEVKACATHNAQTKAVKAHSPHTARRNHVSEPNKQNSIQEFLTKEPQKSMDKTSSVPDHCVASSARKTSWEDGKSHSLPSSRSGDSHKGNGYGAFVSPLERVRPIEGTSNEENHKNRPHASEVSTSRTRSSEVHEPKDSKPTGMASDKQVYRGKDLPHTAELRRNRRGHPYSRPAPSRSKQNYSSFDLAYKDLQELMQCLTCKTYRTAKKHLQSLSTTDSQECRFFNYKFVRSTLPEGTQTEKEPEHMIRPEDITDFEVRRQLADEAEALAEQTFMQHLEDSIQEQNLANNFIILDEAICEEPKPEQVNPICSSTPAKFFTKPIQESPAVSTLLNYFQESQQMSTPASARFDTKFDMGCPAVEGASQPQLPDSACIKRDSQEKEITQNVGSHCPLPPKARQLSDSVAFKEYDMNITDGNQKNIITTRHNFAECETKQEVIENIPKTAVESSIVSNLEVDAQHKDEFQHLSEIQATAAGKSIQPEKHDNQPPSGLLIANFEKSTAPSTTSSMENLKFTEQKKCTQPIVNPISRKCLRFNLPHLPQEHFSQEKLAPGVVPYQPELDEKPPEEDSSRRVSFELGHKEASSSSLGFNPQPPVQRNGPTAIQDVKTLPHDQSIVQCSIQSQEQPCNLIPVIVSSQPAEPAKIFSSLVNPQVSPSQALSAPFTFPVQSEQPPDQAEVDHKYSTIHTVLTSESFQAPPEAMVTQTSSQLPHSSLSVAAHDKSRNEKAEKEQGAEPCANYFQTGSETFEHRENVMKCDQPSSGNKHIEQTSFMIVNNEVDTMEETNSFCASSSNVIDTIKIKSLQDMPADKDPISRLARKSSDLNINPLPTFLADPAEYSHNVSVPDKSLTEAESNSSTSAEHQASLETMLNPELASALIKLNSLLSNIARQSFDLEYENQSALTNAAKSLSQSSQSLITKQDVNSLFCNTDMSDINTMSAKDPSILQEQTRDAASTLSVNRDSFIKGKVYRGKTSLATQLSSPPPPPPPLPPSIPKVKLQIKRPARITFDKQSREYIPNPNMTNSKYQLLEAIIYPARDPRLRPPSKRERRANWKKDGLTLKSGPKCTIKIVKAIPLEPAEKSNKENKLETRHETPFHKIGDFEEGTKFQPRLILDKNDGIVTQGIQIADGVQNTERQAIGSKINSEPIDTSENHVTMPSEVTSNIAIKIDLSDRHTVSTQEAVVPHLSQADEDYCSQDDIELELSKLLEENKVDESEAQLSSTTDGLICAVMKESNEVVSAGGCAASNSVLTIENNCKDSSDKEYSNLEKQLDLLNEESVKLTSVCGEMTNVTWHEEQLEEGEISPEVIMLSTPPKSEETHSDIEFMKYEKSCHEHEPSNKRKYSNKSVANEITQQASSLEWCYSESFTGESLENVSTKEEPQKNAFVSGTKRKNYEDSQGDNPKHDPHAPTNDSSDVFEDCPKGTKSRCGFEMDMVNPRTPPFILENRAPSPLSSISVTSMKCKNADQIMPPVSNSKETKKTEQLGATSDDLALSDGEIVSSPDSASHTSLLYDSNTEGSSTVRSRFTDKILKSKTKKLKDSSPMCPFYHKQKLSNLIQPHIISKSVQHKDHQQISQNYCSTQSGLQENLGLCKSPPVLDIFAEIKTSAKKVSSTFVHRPKQSPSTPDVIILDDVTSSENSSDWESSTSQMSELREKYTRSPSSEIHSSRDMNSRSSGALQSLHKRCRSPKSHSRSKSSKSHKQSKSDKKSKHKRRHKDSKYSRILTLSISPVKSKFPSRSISPDIQRKSTSRSPRSLKQSKEYLRSRLFRLSNSPRPHKTSKMSKRHKLVENHSRSRSPSHQISARTHGRSRSPLKRSKSTIPPISPPVQRCLSRSSKGSRSPKMHDSTRPRRHSRSRSNSFGCSKKYELPQCKRKPLPSQERQLTCYSDMVLPYDVDCHDYSWQIKTASPVSSVPNDSISRSPDPLECNRFEQFPCIADDVLEQHRPKSPLSYGFCDYFSIARPNYSSSPSEWVSPGKLPPKQHNKVLDERKSIYQKTGPPEVSHVHVSADLTSLSRNQETHHTCLEQDTPNQNSSQVLHKAKEKTEHSDPVPLFQSHVNDSLSKLREEEGKCLSLAYQLSPCGRLYSDRPVETEKSSKGKSLSAEKPWQHKKKQRCNSSDPPKPSEEYSHTSSSKPRSGVIMATTDALLKHKPLSELLEVMEEQAKRGSNWILEVHIESLLDLRDTRHHSAKLNYSEVERCMSLIYDYAAKGLIRRLHKCECSLKNSWNLIDMVECLMSRRKDEEAPVILSDPIRKSIQLALVSDHPGLRFADMTSIFSIVKFELDVK